MKILIIDYDAGTALFGGDTHAFDLAVEWKKSGIKPLIVAADYSYLRKRNPEKPQLGQIQEQEGIPFLWIKTPSAADREKKILRGTRPFEKGIRRSMPVIADWKPDAVMLSSRHLLGGRIAAKIAGQLGALLLFDVRRVYPEHLQEVLEYAPGHYLIRRFYRMQKKLYKKSDQVLSVYSRLAEHMAALGADPKKFFPVPQAIPDRFLGEHRPPQRHMDFVDRYREKGYFVCLAGGDIDKDQGLEAFIESAALAPREVLFVLAGNGVFKSQLKRLVKEKGLANVLFLDGVLPDQLVDLYGRADCVYVGLRPYRWHRYGADVSRILLAMAGGVPVVCQADIPKNPVETAGCGAVVPSKNVQDLAKALTRIAILPKEKRMEMGQKGKSYVLEHAGIAGQAAEYWRALQKTAEEKKTGGQ